MAVLQQYGETAELPIITAAELEKLGDVVVMCGLVLDISQWLDKHPGGRKVLLATTRGRDGTEAFEALQHSAKAGEIACSMVVGRLVPHARSRL